MIIFPLISNLYRATLKLGLSGSAVKNLSASVGDVSLIPESGRSPGEGSGYPLQYLCLENPMDRSLAGYSPKDCKELDTTDRSSKQASNAMLLITVAFFINS